MLCLESESSSQMIEGMKIHGGMAFEREEECSRGDLSTINME